MKNSSCILFLNVLLLHVYDSQNVPCWKCTCCSQQVQITIIESISGMLKSADSQKYKMTCIPRSDQGPCQMACNWRTFVQHQLMKANRTGLLPCLAMAFHTPKPGIWHFSISLTLAIDFGMFQQPTHCRLPLLRLEEQVLNNRTFTKFSCAPNKFEALMRQPH